jgi:putative transcriptional regulator
MTKKHKSETLAAVHELMSDFHEIGAIDKKTMRYFDEKCLTPIPELTPTEIKAIRNRVQVSQSVFACYLGVSKAAISQWERGEKKPGGPASLLLSLVSAKGLSAVTL